MGGLIGVVTAPVPLNTGHDIKDFDCGRESLNTWLLRRAHRNEKSGDSRTYVCCDNYRVVADYSLAAGQVFRTEAPKSLTRNSPNPIPLIILGRLAVDMEFQGRGLGAAMLRDAVYRAKAGAKVIGARALMVHALDEDAKSFYEAYGFAESPVAPLTLMLSFKNIIE